MKRIVGAMALVLATIGLTSIACGPTVEVRTTRFADGSPWSESRYTDGRPDGLWTTWYENGQKKSEGRFANGKRVGVWSQWNREGLLVRSGTYANDRLHGPMS